MPAQPNLTVIAYADWKAFKEDEHVGEFKLTFLMLNTQTQQIHNIYKVKEALVSDAIELNSIELDLASYQVSEIKSLIGLRLNYNGHSQPNPYSMQLLDLYDLQEKKKRLNSLIVQRYQAETDTQCNSDVEERNSVLVMQSKKTNHYYDIELRSQIKHYKMVGDRENCKKLNIKLSQQNFILKFDGTQYQLPKNLVEEYQY